MTYPTAHRVTPAGIAYDHVPGRTGTPTVLFLHAGVCDRRMWDAQFAGLPPRVSVIRVDLRGFGASDTATDGWTHVDDVVSVLGAENVGAVHVVAASFGSGVAVQCAQRFPDRVNSLLLAPPGGAMLLTMTPALRAFFDAEAQSLEAGDIDGAVEANIKAWVVGKDRVEADIPGDVADRVRAMQRRAFELAGGISEPSDVDDEPFARAAQTAVPTLIITGALDLDATTDTAKQWGSILPNASVETWPDVAHLPSMEEPERFNHRLASWLDQHDH